MGIRSFLGRASDRLHGRRRLHLLHIGKTGGTALKHVLRRHPRTPVYRFVLHPHAVTLGDVPRGELFMFFLRDPIRRFVSAFWSRQREGRPRYEVPWSDAEREAFGRFRTPNELALALGADDTNTRSAAEAAMRSIGHVRWSYWDWFGSEAAFRSRVPELFFVGFQETLAADFATLRAKLALPASATLPEDDVDAHRRPPDLDTHLDDASQRALRRWYAKDYDFIRLCREAAPDRVSAPAGWDQAGRRQAEPDGCSGEVAG